jgi:hypothetical protein
MIGIEVVFFEAEKFQEAVDTNHLDPQPVCQTQVANATLFIGIGPASNLVPASLPWLSGVEVPKEKGGPEFLNWIGGYFETDWSVNPTWLLAATELAENHPICRGVKPFEVNDEWYYHMRFREPSDAVTAILTAIPPDSTRERPDGAHSNNPTVRSSKGAREVLAWAYERPDGGRGFGCTGGHFHANWGNDEFRKLMLNALAWTSGLDVPDAGISSTVNEDQLEANLDPPPPPRKNKKPASKPKAG